MATPIHIGSYHSKPVRLEADTDFHMACMRRDSARNQLGKIQCL